MKKLLLLLLISNAAFSQFNIHFNATHGNPQRGLFNNKNMLSYIDNNKVTQMAPRDQIFVVTAGPGWGWGVGLSYDKFKLATGIEFNYLNYQRKLEAYKLKAYQVTAYSDYQFRFNNFETYLGLETGIYTTKALFDKEITLAQNLSQSRFGIAPRFGVGLKMNKVKLKLIGKEVINANFPSFMFNILLAYDMGDF